MCRNALPAPPATAVPPREMGGPELAFIGDCVYELLVRSRVIAADAAGVQTLHRRAVALVNAAFQAQAAERLQPLFTERELAIYRRGRNAHVGHTPKNKSEAQYHAATGLEAVIGYLYLCGETERLYELFRFAVEDAQEV